MRSALLNPKRRNQTTASALGTIPSRPHGFVQEIRSPWGQGGVSDHGPLERLLQFLRGSGGNIGNMAVLSPLMGELFVTDIQKVARLLLGRFI